MSTFRLAISSTLNFRTQIKYLVKYLCVDVDGYTSLWKEKRIYCFSETQYRIISCTRRGIINLDPSQSVISAHQTRITLESRIFTLLLVDMMVLDLASSMCDGWDRKWSVYILLFSAIFTIYHVDTGPDTLQWTLPSLPPWPSPLAALNIQHRIKLVNKLDVLYWVTFVHWGVEKAFLYRFLIFM